MGWGSTASRVGWPGEIYAKDYHSILDTLEKINVDTADFRIPTSELRQRVTMVSSSGKSYSDEKYVAKELLLAKLDAVLVYFKITTSEPPKNIGYIKPPSKK